jgi:hypothetical protein
VRVACSAFVVASALATAAASAKCATYDSLKERFDEADRVVLVSIQESRDGPVPWPYGIQKGALPGKLLTLRVLKSWKGAYRVDQTIYGWTQGPRIEDSYPITEVGAKILVFYSEDSVHEIRACNAVAPDRVEEASAALDEIVSANPRDVKPNNRLQRSGEG